MSIIGETTCHFDHVSKYGNSIGEAKFNLILEIPHLTIEMHLQDFMRYGRYYQIFIKIFIEKAQPLYKLLKIVCG